MQKYLLVFSVAILFPHSLVQSQTGIIATWMDFKEAAVSIVYDDNSSDQFEFAAPMMNARNIRGTFFVVPEWSSSVWDSIRAAAKAGHEIGSHTVSHPSMSALSDSDLVAAEIQLKDSRDSIEKMVPGIKCRTLAWPFNRYNQKSKALAAKYYISARQGEGTLEVSSPWDFYAVRSMPFTDSPIPMNGFVEEAIQKKRWLIELLHRVHPGPYRLIYTNRDSVRIHLDYLVARRDSLWIAPYGEVVRYIHERDSSLFSTKAITDTSMVFSLTNTLDDSIYNLPLSLQITLPNGGTCISASQAGEPIPFAIPQGNRGAVRLSAYPNKGDIALRIMNAAPLATQDWIPVQMPGYDLIQDPHSRKALFFRPPTPGLFTVKVIDAMGKEIGRDFSFEAGPDKLYKLQMATRDLPSGRFIVAIYLKDKLINTSSMLFE